MIVLGISAFYHDSAAALIKDGQIIAAAQQERFSRIKHDQSFPSDAVTYCLEEAGIMLDEVDHIAFYDKPLLTFNRLLETYLAYAPSGIKSFIKAISPTSSGIAELLLQTIGVPQLIASSNGKPKPSYIEGKNKTSTIL